MSAPDVVGGVIRILAEIAPMALQVLSAGTSEDALLRSLRLSVEGARSAALARVEGRAGRALHTLTVEAIHITDSAQRLRLLGRPGDALILEQLAAQWRQDVAETP